MTTYDEILNEMKKAYFAECGRDSGSQERTEMRLAAVASELYSLCCANEYVLKQAFPQTAAGKYLDRHAALRDIHRKSASKATGKLVFGISKASDTETVIPLGTICAAENQPYIQFVTIEKGIISAGQTEAIVKAEALAVGDRYNCSPGEISQMVNPPTGVEAVTNFSYFLGGSDEESDEMLRSRILDAFKLSDGISREYLESMVIENTDARDCRIFAPSADGVEIRVRVDNGALSSEQIDAVKNTTLIFDLLGEKVNIYSADSLDFSIVVEIISGDAGDDSIKRRVEDICTGLRIGQSVDLEYIEYALSDICYCKITSPQQAGGFIAVDKKHYGSLSSCEVYRYE